jgi:membrane-associated phospholipid phosphatase
VPRSGCPRAAAWGLRLAITVAATGPAQAQATWHAAGVELGDLAADFGWIWRSPFRADRRDWSAAGATSVGFGALLLVDDRIDGWIVRHPRSALVRSVGPFRESHREIARIPTARRMIPISGALVVAGLISDNRDLREAGLGCLSGWAASNTVRYTIYPVIARARPSASEKGQYEFAIPGRGWSSQSFFAGHGANAFACATFWNERFDLGVAEPALYVAAAAFSLARMADRRHWTSDTFVGTVFGYAVGRTIAARYDRRETRRDARRAAKTNPAAQWSVMIWERTF